MNAGRTASALGKGFVAGLVGTAAMTASSTIEAKLRGRKPSDAPAKAASKVLGVSPVGEDEKTRFSTLVHWLYGTAWGGVRGLLGETNMPWQAATVAHFGTIWGTEAVMLPVLGVSPPVTQGSKEEIAIDLWHHVVYALAAGLTYEWLERSEREAMPVPASFRTKLASGALKAIAGARVAGRVAREAVGVAAEAARERAEAALERAEAARERLAA
jgi:hypothetical protein